MKPKYKQMINRMVEKEKKVRKKIKETWYLYILRCSNGALYTGITNNIERRLKMHNDGKASKYTRTRRPVKLLYQETLMSRAQALVRECEVKGYSKKKKEELVLT